MNYGISRLQAWRGFNRLGRWWHKDNVIDLVALNEYDNEIFFIECKWANLKGNRIRKIFDELKDKSLFVDWNNDAKKHYVIIAQKVDNKEIFRKEGFYIFDLGDMPNCNRTCKDTPRDYYENRYIS